MARNPNPTMKTLHRNPSRRWSLIALLAWSAASNVAFAQTTAQTPDSFVADKETEAGGEVLQLNAYVVVGSTIDKKEMESANSIATLTRSSIDRLAPRSTADMLTQIPGLFVEPTAGQISNNYYIRGLPSGGGTRFLGLVEDGLPVVINNSDFTFRGDALTTDQVEVLRGGASSVLTSYATGGTINFINREGSSAREGAVRFTVSDYGQLREDIYFSGPLSKNVTFSIGGYYNTSESQRDAGWGKAEHGGQLVGNIRFNFADDKGYFKVSFRHLDDQSTYYATELYQNQQHPESVPNGPDISNGTYYGPALSRMTIWTGAGPLVNDFTEGVPVRMTYGGTELKYKFGDGWTILNRNRVTKYDHDFNGLFGGNTVDGTGNALALYGIPKLILSASGKPGFTALAGFASYRVTDAVTGQVLDPATMNGNGAIQLIYPMDETGREKNYQNDFQLQKTLGDWVTTAGVYYSHFEQKFRQFGNQALTDVANHAHLLDVEAFDAQGNSLGFISDKGFLQYGAWYNRVDFTQKNLALYLAEEVKLGNLRLDAGWRHEKVKVHDSQGPRSNYSGFIQRPGNQHNPALYGGNTVTPGAWTDSDASGSNDSMSLGANYLVHDNSAVYGRYSIGEMLNANSTSGVAPPQSKITQMELGYRGKAGGLTWNATLFNSEATNNGINVGIPVNGTLVFQDRFLKTRNYGLELLATVKALRDLSIDFQSTFSKSAYKGEGFVTGSDGTAIPIDGNRPVRQPDTMFSVTARYNLRAQGGGSEIFITNAFIGKRPSDIANTVFLPSYNVINAGIAYRPWQKMTLRLQASNLFNEVGLTEGNPRQTQVAGNANAVYYGARAIFGRSIQFSAEYHF